MSRNIQYCDFLGFLITQNDKGGLHLSSVSYKLFVFYFKLDKTIISTIEGPITTLKGTLC